MADPTLYEVFDHWVETGHHVANHTHLHAGLNWVDALTYIADIERESSSANGRPMPRPIFFDVPWICGATRGRSATRVEAFLKSEGFTSSPLSAWFL